MALAWKRLIPLALANLVGVMIVMELDQSKWWLLAMSLALLAGMAWVAARPSEPELPLAA
jgi:hypothetical protein